ncbi:phage tail tape measure protein [Martelella soudanensis]|uniref:phage tail tape measure protein n=1 Tax=unclassified Martelella TaxID=2629616 RepID=UPI0015DF2546|nr:MULTISPECIES: phage tail tape measure protein [unclassified Martelella]
MSRPDIPVTIGADDREFKGAMTRIRMQARTAANDTASSFLSIKSKIGGADSLFGMLSGGPGGLAASLGIGSFVAATQQAVDAVTDLGKAAKTAGVDFEAFQELRYAAVKNKVGVDALTDGLKEMQLRADEFVKTGGGSAAESFERLGLSARQLTRMLEDPATMFETLIGKIRELDRAAQIRVLDELFGGTAAEQFSSLMDDAGQSIADARQEARDMGAVMDEELLRKAEDVNAEWEAMSLVIGTRVKSSLVEISGLVSALVSNLGSFRKSLDEVLEKAGNAGIWTGLGNMLGVDMGQKMVWRDGEGWVPDDSGGTTELDPIGVETRRSASDDYADYNAGREILEEKLAANRAVTAELQRQNGMTSEQLALEKEMAAVRKLYEDAGGAPTEEMIRAEAEARLAARASRDASQKASRAAAQDSAKEREAVDDLIQALQDELQMLAMVAEEKKVFENLRRAGAAATENEREAIRDLTYAIEDQKDKQEQAAETADFFRDSARDSFLSLIPVIETGNDALDRLISRLMEAAAQAALFGDGPLGGLFGGGLLSGLFPAHATGTNFTQGGMALVGERGPELVNLPRGGEVIPRHRIGTALSAGAANASGTVNNINLGGINIAVPEGTSPNDAAAIAREVRSQIDSFSRHELPGRMRQIQRNPNRVG